MLFLIGCIVVYEAMYMARMLKYNREYYERGTIQRIAESLHKGGFGKYDKG